MALLAPGLDPRSPRGLPFFWLPLLPLLLTAGGRGQGPLPRVIYQAGKCPTARDGQVTQGRRLSWRGGQREG